MVRWETLPDGRIMRVTKGGVSIYHSMDEYHSRLAGNPAPPVVQIDPLTRSRGFRVKLRHIPADRKRFAVAAFQRALAGVFVDLVKAGVLPNDTRLVMRYDGAGGFTGKTADDVAKWLKKHGV